MIDNKLLTFTLNDEKIVIKLPEPNFFLTNYDRLSICFYHNNQEILLSSLTALDFIDTLCFLLSKALKNELQLDESLNQDLGFMLNRWFKEKKFKFISVTKNGDTYWVGNNYQLASGKFASWIYNNIDGDIIFEITPVYSGIFIHENKPPYREYMKWRETYKPYFAGVISKKIARQWIDQSQNILNEIEKNMNKMHSTTQN